MEETTLLKLDKVDICREENVILHRASFTLHNGEFVYVIGKVGSGKSSLLKSLYCEIPINQGDAWLLDYNLCKMRRKDIPYLRRKLGIVFQDFQLLTDRSVHKNLEFVLKATGWKKKSEINERINNVLFQVGMQDKGYKMPHELSGGEQQRVSIARALAKRPRVLFLDEPTGALDEQTGRQVLDYICKLQKEYGFTIVMVTHNLNIAEMANTVIKMNSGKISEIYTNESQKTDYEIGW